MGFVISLNLNRRHLTTGQKAAIAVEMLPMLQAEAKERQRYHGGTAPGRSKDETLSIKRCEVNEPSTRRNRATEVAANMVGISSPTVERMAKVTRESPELAGQVKSGEKTVEKAYRELHPRKKSIPELARDGIPPIQSKQQVGTFVCKELDTGNPAPEQKQAVKKVATAGRVAFQTQPLWGSDEKSAPQGNLESSPKARLAPAVYGALHNFSTGIWKTDVGFMKTKSCFGVARDTTRA